MRQFTTQGLNELLRENITHVFSFAADIYTVSMVESNSPDYRIIADTVNHTINGHVYTAFPFEVILPTAEEDALPTVKCTLVNTGGEMVAQLRQLNANPTVDLYITRYDFSDTYIEVGPMRFSVLSVEWNDTEIIFTLGFEYHYLQEPAMIYGFTPDIARGLF